LTTAFLKAAKKGLDNPKTEFFIFSAAPPSRQLTNPFSVYTMNAATQNTTGK
jgi:hypothetical protein